MSQGIKERFTAIIKKQGLLLALVIIVLVFSLSTKTFFTVNNLILIFSQVSIVGIIACAMCYVIIGGNLDLSVGYLVSMTAVLSVGLHDKTGPLASIIISLAIGVISGLICGFFIGYLKLNSLIVTLGMLSILQGATLLFSGGGVSRIQFPHETWFQFIGKGSIFRIPFPVILFLFAVVVFGIILKYTVFGKQLLAVGGNACASRFTGINDKRIILITFVLSGLMSALAGIVLGSRATFVQPGLGAGYEFDVITGVILGGTSLRGGEGNIAKTFLGILVLGILQNGFIMLGFPYYTQWIIQWFIIVLVVWIDVFSKRKESIE